MTVFRPCSKGLQRKIHTACASIALSGAVLFYTALPVRPAFAQTMEPPMRSVEPDARWMDGVDRKLAEIDTHLTATDRTVYENSAAISRIVGIGIGAMGLLAALEIYQIKLKGRTQIGE